MNMVHARSGIEEQKDDEQCLVSPIIIHLSICAFGQNSKYELGRLTSQRVSSLSIWEEAPGETQSML